MNLWRNLGFRENLYATPPLKGTAEGSQLLVGRDREVRKLLTHLSSFDTHPTLEGDNGVGKTSLVSVALYRASLEYAERRTTQLIIPLPRPFQLGANNNFEQEVVFSLTKALIDNNELLEKSGRRVRGVKDLESWISNPMIRQKSGGISTPVGGFTAGVGASANTTSGFAEAGLRNHIETVLREIFPDPSTGGFAAVIDNLELLDTSQEAKRLIEEARDTVLNFPGVRWILCGARGIVRSAAGSPRLTGVIADPIRVDPIKDSEVVEVIRRRIEVYRLHPAAQSPIEPEGFDHLYRVSHKNLRNTLKHAQDFTMWLEENDELEVASEARLELLHIWIAEQADRYEQDTRNVTKRGWTFFDDLVASGGTCSPSDFASFGFNSIPAMRPYVKQLEDANLMHSTVDESDSRRRTIGLTSNGWLVNYKRSGYQEPPAGLE